MAARLASVPETRPGRICPLSYRYSPRVFDRAAEIVADTLYVAGGLYGNVEALDALAAMALRERGPVTLVFNGDFHWFDVEAADFRAIAEGVEPHWKLRGNVETEIASEESGAGCGCARVSGTAPPSSGLQHALCRHFVTVARHEFAF